MDEGLPLAAALGDIKENRIEQGEQAARESLQTVLEGVTLALPSVSLVSSATGQVVDSADELDIDYWL